MAVLKRIWEWLKEAAKPSPFTDDHRCPHCGRVKNKYDFDVTWYGAMWCRDLPRNPGCGGEWYLYEHDSRVRREGDE